MRVESEQLRAFADDLMNSAPVIQKLINKSTIRIAVILEAHIKEKAPQFQGNLVNSIRGRAKVQGRAHAAVVSSSVAYAKVQDEGRRPGKMPPHDPIRRWVELKLFKRAGIAADGMDQSIDSITYLIRRAIGRKGTKATKYITRGIRAATPQIEAELKRLGEEIRRYLEDE